ncbi:STAS domain-containing protein [Paenibacillus sp. UNC451MF]|uniref:STAS domain-containing protein n=1 Tax=Paenibacillus sp. UNC451MF TaxID=1449063 RepID=UPI00048F2A96|nr:STAS domain-containing protein [Paenibacillus sp. UNC451MF]
MGKTAYDPHGSGEGLFIHFSSSLAGAYLHIIATGKLTYGHDSKAKEWLNRVLKPAEGYIIDLTGLTLIDSTGLGVLLHFKKTYCTEGRRMAVIVQDELMKELITIAKLHMLMPICGSLQEAVQRLGESYG